MPRRAGLVRLADHLEKGDLEVSCIGEALHERGNSINGLPAVDAWRVIGHFGSAVGDVPRVLPAAVLDPSGTFVVNSDVADNEAGLRTLASMAVSEFLSCVETGGASMLEPVMWEPGAVLLTVEGYVERLSVWEAELILNRFVREQRAVGRLLLSVATGKPLST